jgi:hypothetical protein
MGYEHIKVLWVMDTKKSDGLWTHKSLMGYGHIKVLWAMDTQKFCGMDT